MIEVEYISYLLSGKAIKFRPKTKLLLPIKLPSHRKEAHFSGEWKVKQAKKQSPYQKYKLKEKKKVMIAKCKCQVCGVRVENWIQDKCVLCYNASISKPHEDRANRLQDCLNESNKMWADITRSYRNKKLVRLGNAIQRWVWFPYFFARRAFFFVFLMCFGMTNEISRLFPSKKKLPSKTSSSGSCSGGCSCSEKRCQ